MCEQHKRFETCNSGRSRVGCQTLPRQLGTLHLSKADGKICIAPA